MKKAEKPICILATGGTISMEKTKSGYRPVKNFLEKAMTKIPELENPDMPKYVIHEFEELLDSANMTPDNWNDIGKHIQKYHDEFAGFVVLHGTDTMAYSASALSFMLENLNKPVILTGSQLPLFETRSDARENLINALWIAGNYSIPEVCIYFNAKLFRGNRAKKIDAMGFSAFASPNFPRLGKIGTSIIIRKDLFIDPPTESFQLQTIETVPMGVLRIFPGMSIEMLQQIFQTPLKALVLQTYGVGNAMENKTFLNALSDAVEKGTVIVNCSQCSYAKVRMSDYAAGNALSERGVISGADMTTEAALAKLFYLHSKELEIVTLKNQMTANLRGELTP